MDIKVGVRFDEFDGIKLTQGETREITMAIYDERFNTPVNLTGGTVEVSFPLQGGGSIKRTNGPITALCTNVSVASASSVLITDHGFVTGDPVTVAAVGSGTLPGGLASATNYTINVLDNNDIQFVNSSGAVVTLTSQGSGSFNITNASDVVLVSGDLGQVTLTLRPPVTAVMNAAEAQTFQVAYTVGGETRIKNLVAKLDVWAQSVP